MYSTTELTALGTCWMMLLTVFEPPHPMMSCTTSPESGHSDVERARRCGRSRLHPRAVDGLAINGQEVRVLATPAARNSRPYDGRPPCAGNSSCIPICPIGAKYDGYVHVQLKGDQRNDWDLALFDAASGRRIDASLAWGANEVTQAWVKRGQSLTRSPRQNALCSS